MESFTLDTPGKVNLFLRVCGRRSDGYHEIETLFFPVQTVADTVSMRFPDGGEIHIRCSDPAVPADESNLCWKAADLYRKFPPMSRISAGRPPIFIGSVPELHPVLKFRLSSAFRRPRAWGEAVPMRLPCCA